MIASSIGLCLACVSARRIESARGSVFLRCGRHDVDVRFAKYPRLPVISCAGFQQVGHQDEEQDA